MVKINFNTLYHVYGLTNESGNLVEGCQYDAYGKATVLTDGNSNGTVDFDGTDDTADWSSVANPYQYTGQRYNPETGWIYYKNRYYDTGTGRFISRDPVGYRYGLSLYQYVRSNPLGFSDPGGLTSIAPGYPDLVDEFYERTKEQIERAINEKLDHERINEIAAACKKDYDDEHNCAIEYREKYWTHKGLLINGTVYDFGPWLLPLPIWIGDSPWNWNDVDENTDFGEKKHLTRKKDGFLAGTNIECKDATCEEIQECVDNEADDNWNKKKLFTIFGPNYWTFVDTAKDKCCLE